MIAICLSICIDDEELLEIEKHFVARQLIYSCEGLRCCQEGIAWSQCKGIYISLLHIYPLFCGCGAYFGCLQYAESVVVSVLCDINVLLC
jgi:hypothetical protein